MKLPSNPYKTYWNTIVKARNTLQIIIIYGITFAVPWFFMQGRQKVFMTGQIKLNSEQYLINYMGG